MHSSLFAAGFSLVLCLFFVFVFCFQKCKSFARPEDSEMRVNLNFIRHYCFDDRKLNHYLILLLKSCAVDLPQKNSLKYKENAWMAFVLYIFCQCQPDLAM